MSSFSINDERVQTVDMVSYFTAGTSLAVKTGNPDGIRADDLCGKAVGVQAGTVQVDDLAARNTQCTTTGKAPIAVSELQAQTDVTLAPDREPGAGHAGRLAGRRLRGQDHRGRGGGGRRALRHRAVRHRAGQEPGRLRQGRAGRDAGPDRTTAATARSWRSGTCRAGRSRPPSCAAERCPTRPAGAAATDTVDRKHPIEAVPVRHPGRWVAVAVLAVLAAMFVNTVLTNDGFRWPVVGRYLFAEPVLNGLRNTLILTVLSMAIGIVGGVALAVMRLSPNWVLSGVAGVYIWLFRGTPADRPAAVLELPGRAVPAAVAGHPVRAGVRLLRHQPADQPVHRLPARARAERGRVHGRDRARRAGLGGRGPDRGGRRAGHVPGPDAAPDRAAAGHAGDHPADRQRDHLDAQDHLAGGGHRLLRAAHLGAADLLDQLPDDPAAHRGRHLVPGPDLGAVDRAGLHRAALRARHQPRPTGPRLLALAGVARRSRDR